MWQLVQAGIHANATALVQALTQPSIEAPSYPEVSEVAAQLLREWARPGVLEEWEVLIPGVTRADWESKGIGLSSLVWTG